MVFAVKLTPLDIKEVQDIPIEGITLGITNITDKPIQNKEEPAHLLLKLQMLMQMVTRSSKN